MNWESLFTTINKKIKTAEENRDYYWNNRAGLRVWIPAFNHNIGYLEAMIEMKELLRKRRSREQSR